MARVKGRDSKPELVVRRLLHRLGYRFRLQRRDLPGTPDIVLPGRKVAIFVHGCFWHRHPGCKLTTTPKTRELFWKEKFERNIKRDELVVSRLRELNWAVFIVWECETRNQSTLSGILIEKLGPPGRGAIPILSS